MEINSPQDIVKSNGVNSRDRSVLANDLVALRNFRAPVRTIRQAVAHKVSTPSLRRFHIPKLEGLVQCRTQKERSNRDRVASKPHRIPSRRTLLTPYYGSVTEAREGRRSESLLAAYRRVGYSRAESYAPLDGGSRHLAQFDELAVPVAARQPLTATGGFKKV